MGAAPDAAHASHPHWDSLDDAEVGDLVVHYARQYAIAISRVAIASTSAVRPREFKGEARTGDLGRIVYLDDFQLFVVPVQT